MTATGAPRTGGGATLRPRVAVALPLVMMAAAAVACASMAFAQAPATPASPTALQAEAAGGPIMLDIPPQSLSSALIQYGHSVGAEIMFSPAAVRDKFSRAVQGKFTREEALHALLHGSDLSFRITRQGVIVIEVP